MGNKRAESLKSGDKADSLLLSSFDEFHRSNIRLQQAFQDLGAKFERINRELEQKNRELKDVLLEKSRISDYLENILESLTTGIIVTDNAKKITVLNRYAEIFTGFSLEESRGRYIEGLFGNVKNLDGNTPALFSSDFFGEEILVMGERMIETSISSVKARRGEEIGKVLVLRDVTAIKRLEERAKRSEKFAAMGELVANIAHEIRNPLGSIELYASLLEKEFENRICRDRARQIIGSVKNVDTKISNLLIFAEKRNPAKIEVNINEIIEEVVIFAKQITVHEDIEINLRNLTGDSPLVLGDGEMLKQVFLNLMMNSLHAIQGSGKVSIDLKVVAIDGITGCSCPHVAIKFSDTGVGIPRSNIRKIFDPFFTTKKGESGLGLAIVHGILDIHGGTIDVESRRRNGTTFTVTLPLMKH